MNLRESYASTHHAGLMWSPLEERAIDRVAASAFCEPLAINLVKARYLNEGRAMRDAERGLASLLGARYKRDAHALRRLMARQTMREYVFEFCQTCFGVGEKNTPKLRVVCPTCNGSRVRNYSDLTRASQMGLSLATVRLHAHKQQYLTDWVWSKDRLVNAILVTQLDRQNSRK